MQNIDLFLSFRYTEKRRSVLRTLWPPAAQVPQGTPEGLIHQPVDLRRVDAAPQRSRPTGTGDAGVALSLAGTHQHRQDAAQRAASCSILFSAGKTCVRLSCGAGLSGEAQHFPGLHLYLLGLSACVSLFSTSRTTSGGNRFSNFSALRQRDSNAEMWARC